MHSISGPRQLLTCGASNVPVRLVSMLINEAKVVYGNWLAKCLFSFAYSHKFQKAYLRHIQKSFDP